jgi:hypothetical protein
MIGGNPRGDGEDSRREDEARFDEGAAAASAGEQSGEEEGTEFAAPEYLELTSQQAAREAVLARATLRRIERMILISGSVCAVVAVWPLGVAVASGILLGTLLSWVNFRWLAASVHAIGNRIAAAQEHGDGGEKAAQSGAVGGASVMLHGGGRIVLIALVAYGIFTYSSHALMGFLAGLAMPVVAMMCEAAYEFSAASRRPF